MPGWMTIAQKLRRTGYLNNFGTAEQPDLKRAPLHFILGPFF
jgi:hypothetical protein